MDPTNLLFIPLTKVDLEQQLVYGVGAAEVADKSNEILDYASTKPLVQKWSANQFDASMGKSYGNIRLMHRHEAVGKIAEPIGFNDEAKQFELCVKVTDPTAWDAVKEGVLTGFSIGGGYHLGKKWTDPANPMLKRYTAAPTEFSLVDLPCIPGSTFVLVKSAGVEETVEFKKVAARADVSPATGAKKYGAVEYADATNKKYPLDTAAHVRAAASYWGMPKNRGKYSAADQKSIGAKIAAAEKRLGIGSKAEKAAMENLGKLLTDLDALLLNAALKKGAGADKMAALAASRTDLGQVFTKLVAAKEAGTRLAKGMWGVSSLAMLVGQLDSCAKDAEYEAASEGDESEVPAMLADLRTKAGEILVLMVQEETDELTPEDDNVEKLQKMLADLAELMKGMDAGELKKALGPENMKHVQGIHDKSVELGAKHNGKHDGEEGLGGTDEEKAEKVTKAVAAAMVPLVERLTKLEAQPVAGVTPASLDAAALAKLAGSQENFKPRGMGVGGGEQALKAVPVLDLIKAAQAGALPLGQGHDLPAGKGNLAKLAA